MYPKIRSPLLVWLFTILSGGLYLFYWCYRVSAELNAAEEQMVLKVNEWGAGSLVAVALLIILTINPLLAGFVFPGMILVFYVLGLFLYVQISIGRYIRSKENTLKLDNQYNHWISLLLMWFVMNIGVAYIQQHINKIIDAERSKS